MNCAEVNQKDMVDYLQLLGYQQKKINNNDYWYLSPLRNEKEASFKINRIKNTWYDYGMGKGGRLVDFGTLYFNCSVADLLNRLSPFQNDLSLSFHQQNLPNYFSQVSIVKAGEKKEPADDAKIIVLEAKPLAEKSLLEYLQKRKIPLPIANRFCREVDFLLYGKKQTVIGFQNNAGGYELRGPHFKGSSSPKAISFFDHGKEKLTVFEGFFNYLSYQTINQQETAQLTNFLVLNSLSFFQKEKERMENHRQINLYLDNDPAGTKCTQQALEWSQKFIDHSHLYKPQKDLNEYLQQKQAPKQKQTQHLGRRL